MNIKDIRPNTGNIEVVGEITDKGEPRGFEKFGKKGQVCKSTLADATGSVVLTLWNEDIEKVNVGDTIKVKNGWCSAYKGEVQLSTGKYGKIELMPSSPQVFTNDPAILGGGGGGEEGPDEERPEESVPEEEFLDE